MCIAFKCGTLKLCSLFYNFFLLKNCTEMMTRLNLGVMVSSIKSNKSQIQVQKLTKLIQSTIVYHYLFQAPQKQELNLCKTLAKQVAILSLMRKLKLVPTYIWPFTSSETWMESSKQPVVTVLALQKVGFEYNKYTESMGWDLGELNVISQKSWIQAQYCTVSTMSFIVPTQKRTL